MEKNLTETIIEAISALRYELAKGDVPTEKSCSEYSQPVRPDMTADCNDTHIRSSELTVNANLYGDGTLSVAVVYAPKQDADRQSLKALFKHYRCIDARRAIDEKKAELKRLEAEIAEMEQRKSDMINDLNFSTINDD